MQRVRRRAAGGLLALMAAMAWILPPHPAATAAEPRVDLRVLVVTNGDATISAIADRLAAEGVPYRLVDLRDPGRPVIDAAFLSDTVGGVPRAKYQGVVLPNADPFGGSAEFQALVAYEKRFGIRQLDAYVYPSPAVGLASPGYSGPLDGVTTAVTPAALAGAHQYLRGPVRFEDVDPDIDESYGYVAAPLPDDPAAGTSFVPYVTTTAHGVTGVLAGVHTRGGRSEMVLTFAANAHQWHFRALAHGLITWLTRGVHLGYQRNYFSVHVDDIFLPNARWDAQRNCTPGSDCPRQEPVLPRIRMVPADVRYAAEWQRSRSFSLEMAFNGKGNEDQIEDYGTDPLADAFVAQRASFRWLNHTFGHEYLGCERDFTVSPWRCVTDPVTGLPEYASQAKIRDEISRNLAWARGKGLSVPAGELVTGEHSGMRILPQQPADNPALAPALTETGIRWLASDASRGEPQRQIGSARTLPRHPMSLFFNVATREDEVDEYNWIYTARADGGSGLCEDNPATTCIDPLDPETGYDAHIIPIDARVALYHVLGNDPRPHYVHQSNIAEDRLLYPLLDRVLGDYRATFAAAAPVVNARMTALGTVLQRQEAWRAALRAGEITAYTQGRTLVVRAPSGKQVPVTVPNGTVNAAGTAFGEAYAGERSAFQARDLTLTLPAGTR
ncbi:hypothetical protein SMC26_41020 [Actinomadura fulvescens]|uniref:Secreted protein n=1 Tax=Actinomadura fulvescens TaxID=46160 RepID=A0ABP6BZI5_9ACTN